MRHQQINTKLEVYMFFFFSIDRMSMLSLSFSLYLLRERKHMHEHKCQYSRPAAVPPLIIMAFLYHNNAIRSVFCNSSHLCYRCQQSKICHYLHDRDRAFCNYWACLCGNYFSLLNYKSWKEGREEPRPWAETEIFFRRLKSWETFLGSGIITYTHLPETVDRKYALSAEITTLFFFSPAPTHPPAFVATVRPDSLTKDKAPQWGISINQTHQQERRPPISASTPASFETPSQALLPVFMFLWLLLATYSGAGDNNYPVGNLSLTVPPCPPAPEMSKSRLDYAC